MGCVKEFTDCSDFHMNMMGMYMVNHKRSFPVLKAGHPGAPHYIHVYVFVVFLCCQECSWAWFPFFPFLLSSIRLVC